jgi:hypothetical protein
MTEDRRSCIVSDTIAETGFSGIETMPEVPLRAIPSSADTAAIAVQARRKIAWRILPFVFVLYIIAYLDRANVAFAKVPMSADLGFSEAVFGFGAGIFFLGYFLLEIPGALIVEHWSARRWIARILISWGFCTVLVGLVRSDTQFYLARFLLGAAEAGFFPGVILYLTYWFPQSHRARCRGDETVRHWHSAALLSVFGFLPSPDRGDAVVEVQDSPFHGFDQTIEPPLQGAALRPVELLRTRSARGAVDLQ